MPHPILDDPQIIPTVDKSNVLSSILGLKDQLLHAWDEAKKVEVPKDYRQVKNVVMCGMGGSGLGARLIESIYGPHLTLPLVRLNDYHLPAWVGPQTLVFVSSFSGTTEETVQNLKEALAKQAPILVIAAGGTLIDLAKQHHLPYYQIDPVYNPSKQPRLAIGYSVIGQLALASHTGLFNLTTNEIKTIITKLQAEVTRLQPEIPTDQNPAKQWAENLNQRFVIYLTARHLLGAAHTVKNQLNENSKQASALFDLPELNHHLMEGLKHPDTNPSSLAFILIDSPLFEPRLKQRLSLTAEVIRQHSIPVHVWQSDATGPLEDAFRFIQFGAFVNFYLNLLYHLDPAPIPWVDWFKQQLGQPLGQWK